MRMKNVEWLNITCCTLILLFCNGCDNRSDDRYERGYLGGKGRMVENCEAGWLQKPLKNLVCQTMGTIHKQYTTSTQQAIEYNEW